MSAGTCKHAASGCDYPTGQCDGSCMAKPAQSAAAERRVCATAEGKVNAELLRELQLAHEIVRNALSLMTPAQRTDWAFLNVASGNDSDGTTRFHERAAVIARATGAQS
ncbi:hypothetical protein D9X30_3449 [Cupriavidus sp. U2]|uniref:hypothetical protein n=1 Tax=Cupriavidus sp. U2 TaxID=2920269 RepID=UPI00129D2841|nr:hypothetical protein [Cupriavidus sp. U2]KAI3591624.1 hypothetical protein D9X30_3449 [Cupriavidus sp. U2]